ncbi:STAS/SEC14 domain-containing protein [Niabella sp. W65]|nr:STAS/SEC14 domain-containing protein [Niabella sp. W65]MCH7367091.1 STAS/SEC14 domain-containing protein [Niabella sp. W65]
MGTINGNDFATTLVPAMQQYKRQHKELNYMLVLEHDLSNFSITWWIKSLWLAIRDWSTWKRCAIISDLQGLKTLPMKPAEIYPESCVFILMNKWRMLYGGCITTIHPNITPLLNLKEARL